jgi:crotonobetainyl-CoA:carnitine CoA-transferase CaiB-like acyl-CoA transferase
VNDALDTAESDPQIAHRGLFFELDHPVIGPARFEGLPFNMRRSEAEHWRSAPLLGEDNGYVFGEILGIDDDELERLGRAGVI